MRRAHWLPSDDAIGEPFCPECGQPWGRKTVAPVGEEKRRGGLISPWILIAVGLYVVVTLLPAAWTDYQFAIDEETAARVATSTRDELAARDARAIAGVYLSYDLQELALAVLIGIVGMSAIARRKLQTAASRSPSEELSRSPGQEPRKRWRSILGAWALAETIGTSFVHVLLVIYAFVIVGLERHSVVLSAVLLNQAWRVTFGIVVHAFNAPILG